MNTQIDEEELKKKLTPEQYKVLREGATEAPYSSEFVHSTDKGMFACAVCGNQLFKSDAKFVTNLAGLRGWPSFDEAIPGSIKMEEDNSLGMRRTAVKCANCGSHLGHVFDDDSETQTGKHFCINGSCLIIKKEQE